MVKCSFCGEDISKGTGKIYGKKDGTTYHFCSSKCEKNQLKLKRSSRKTKWTKIHHDLKEQSKK
ncbi:MAG: 50S ribosomal protein L24e [Candidatus Diapherotrites archaeon]